MRTSPSYLRRAVFQRDLGICAMCGTDTVALKQEFREFSRQLKKGDDWYGVYFTEKAAWMKARGIPIGRMSTDWWDADHIVPVIEGGGETGLYNFRTLCIPCHRSETRALHARLKARRIAAKPSERR